MKEESVPAAPGPATQDRDWSELAAWILDRLLQINLTGSRNQKFLTEQLAAQFDCGYECAKRDFQAEGPLKAEQT